MERRSKPYVEIWQQTYEEALCVNNLPEGLLPSPWEGRISLAILRKDDVITKIEKIAIKGSVNDLLKHANHLFGLGD